MTTKAKRNVKSQNAKSSSSSESKPTPKLQNKQSEQSCDSASVEPQSKKMKRDVRLKVFSFGRGFCGELAQGDDKFVSKYPEPVVGLPDDAEIVDVQCGSMHALVLLADGSVYASGCSENNANGCIKFIKVPSGENSDTNQKSQTEDEFIKIDESDDDDSKFENEKLQIDDSEDFSFKKLKLPFKVSQIACGHSFSVFLDVNGSVYVCGVFTDDQGVMHIKKDKKTSHYFDKLPHGIAYSFKLTKLKIPAVVKKIKTGKDHLVCMTTKNQVYTIGSSACGQLCRVTEASSKARGGRNGLLKFLTPHVIAAHMIKKVDDISTGPNNTVISDSQGRMWICGINTFHQTGISNERHNLYGLTQFKPHSTEMAGTKILAADFSLSHGVFLSNDGYVYTCGQNMPDLLGCEYTPLSDDDKEYTPNLLRVTLPGSKSPAVKIACGVDSTFVITEDGVCYSWGINSYENLAQDLAPKEISSPKPINLGSSQITRVRKVSVGNAATFILAECE